MADKNLTYDELNDFLASQDKLSLKLIKMMIEDRLGEEE